MADRGRVEAEDLFEIAALERPNPVVRRTRGLVRGCQPPIAHGDVEPASFVEGPSGVGGNEHQSPATAGLQVGHDGVRQRRTQSGSSPAQRRRRSVPTQPTCPCAVAIPCPPRSPPASATNGGRTPGRQRKKDDASPQLSAMQQLRGGWMWAAGHWPDRGRLGERMTAHAATSLEGAATIAAPGCRAPGDGRYHRPVAGLTRSDVEHVAYLARLRLTDEELDRLEGQLNHILDQYAKLSELDTSAIPPTAQTIELENILRDDVASASLPVEDVLRNARLTDGDFIVVPPILGGDAS